MKKLATLIVLLFVLSMTNLYAQNTESNMNQIKPGMSKGKKGNCKGGKCKKGKSGKKGGCKGGHGRKGGHVSFLKFINDLTPEQLKAIYDVRLKYKKLGLEIKEKMAPKKFKLKRLLLDEKPNLDEVKKLVEEIAQYKAQKKFLKIKKRLEIFDLLTQKQKDSIKMRMMGKFDS